MKVFKDHLVVRFCSFIVSLARNCVSVRMQVQGWQADGDTRTFKTWVSELNDHDDRVILIHEMEHPVGKRYSKRRRDCTCTSPWTRLSFVI